jgi:hypothetical protein
MSIGNTPKMNDKETFLRQVPIKVSYNMTTGWRLSMNHRTITLPADLVERFELLADQSGRSVDELFAELLSNYAPSSDANNWALTVAAGMETAGINWIDDPDASAKSRERFKQHLDEKWKRTQNTGGSDA